MMRIEEDLHSGCEDRCGNGCRHLPLEPPTPGPSNCGLPEGIIHQHVGICYRAGYEAGRAEYSSISEERDQLREQVAAVRALADELVDAGMVSIYESAGEIGEMVRAALNAPDGTP